MPKLPSFDLMLDLFMKPALALADRTVPQEPVVLELEQEQRAEVLTSKKPNTDMENPKPDVAEQKKNPNVLTTNMSDKSDAKSETSIYKDSIRSIDDSLFVKLILSIWDPEGYNGLESVVKVVKHDEGSYSYCVTLRLDAEDDEEAEETDQMVVRVPFDGTREIWTDDHAFEFRTEVMNQTYLCNKTKVPVPSVLEWDDGFDNILGAPFVIMPRVGGRSAIHNLWYTDEMWDLTDNGDLIIPGAGSPSPALEARRQRFLKDLAKLMADLQNHEFDKIGALHIEDRWDAPPPTVGHYFQHSPDGSMIKTGPFSSTSEYLQHKKREIQERDTSHYEEDEMDEALGFKKIGAIMCDALPRSVNKPVADEAYATAPETFVLAHPDLDLQNIFVDNYGKITGIIDWSGLRTVPRWAGFASLPLFLRKDFDGACRCRVGDSIRFPLQTWQLEPYREAYHSYLAEALDPEGTGSYSDAAWTLRSGATCAAIEAMEREFYRNSAIQRLLKELPELKGVHLPDFRPRLGLPGGWPEAEAMLKKAFKSLFTQS